MKVTKLRTKVVRVPLDKPLATAIHRIEAVGCVLVTLETDQPGLVGEGMVFTLNGARLAVFEAMIASFADRVEGMDPHYTEALFDDVWRSVNFLGQQGIAIAALTAVDTACWDIVGKAAGQPLHRLFGACRDRVRTYASGGQWLSMTVDEIVAEAAGFVEQGFRALKIRVGSPDPATDAERVGAVRAAVGPGIEILTDANQGLDAKHAIRLGRMLEAHGVAWLEEPVPASDLSAQARVRAALDIPLAAGETVFTRHGLRDTIRAEAADILMPDLQRMGGLTEMRRAAAMAHGFDLPVSTHIFTEFSLALGGSAPNCISVEHMPWFQPLFREALEIDAGDLLIPDRPGTGFTFDPDAGSRFAV